MNLYGSIKAEDLLWIYRFGLPKRKISTEELMEDLSVLETPVFFLSTGRCGTKWFHEIVRNDRSVKDFHSPYPNLSLQNKYMYSLRQKKGKDEQIGIGNQIFLASREQHLRYSYKCKKRYFETNNHITFFAHSIAVLIPQAKFVHLYRHPAEFVRSGIRRGWYSSNAQANAKLIEPAGNSNWEHFSQLERVAWLWNETNSFIEDFKRTYPDRVVDFNFNALSENSINTLFEFIEVSISKRVINNKLSRKTNIQKGGSFPVYDEWTEEQRSQLAVQTGKLAKKYGYSLT